MISSPLNAYKKNEEAYSQIHSQDQSVAKLLKNYYLSVEDAMEIMIRALDAQDYEMFFNANMRAIKVISHLRAHFMQNCQPTPEVRKLCEFYGKQIARLSRLLNLPTPQEELAVMAGGWKSLAASIRV